jgi:thiol:disulfide interchange protein DsbD
MRRNRPGALAAALLGFAALAALPALAQNPGELLDPDKAFRISARALDERHAEVEFKIARGYYMYRNRFSFATDSGKPLADVEIPRGKEKEDPFFGKTETFRDLVRIRVPLALRDVKAGAVNLKVTSQGCADVGVCYAPLEQSVRVDLAKPAGAASPARAIRRDRSPRGAWLPWTDRNGQ